MIDFRICQYCRESERTDNLLKYGVRHYCHLRCAHKALTEDAFKDLLFKKIPVWRVKLIPYFEAEELGILPLLRSILGHELEVQP